MIIAMYNSLMRAYHSNVFHFELGRLASENACMKGDNCMTLMDEVSLWDRAVSDTPPKRKRTCHACALSNLKRRREGKGWG